jgi:hypothetical protein
MGIFLKLTKKKGSELGKTRRNLDPKKELGQKERM